MVFCHGGGWVLGDLDRYDATARALCRASGAVLVSVDYRRAPEARFPAAVHDAYAALCWAGAHIEELGGDRAALVVAGDSAGGNLAAASSLLARERGGPAVALQVLIYPCLDAAQDAGSYRSNAEGYFLTSAHLRWFWEQYLGPGGDGGHPLASPLVADPRGLPPAYVVVAGCDPLRDEGRPTTTGCSAPGSVRPLTPTPECSTGSSHWPECSPRRARPWRGWAKSSTPRIRTGRLPVKPGVTQDNFPDLLLRRRASPAYAVPT